MNNGTVEINVAVRAMVTHLNDNKSKKRQWLLRLHIGIPNLPTYITFGLSHLNLLIEAETEDEARKMADEYDKGNSSCEVALMDIEHPWLSNVYSSCEAISK